ncbi:hypothetical protein Fmac_004488 [Flemingia macrophylla]|uniref:Uncharacterized protein n=1 Tax=Flemingia macrophylla TaxID=520843 RepID=A0ABD1N6J1_9FABA
MLYDEQSINPQIRDIRVLVRLRSTRVTSDHLRLGKMELGLGIHGELDAVVVFIKPINVVVSRVLHQILSTETKYLPIPRGERMCLDQQKSMSQVLNKNQLLQINEQGQILEVVIEVTANINLKDSLNEWDGKIDDGDCGSTMNRDPRLTLDESISNSDNLRESQTESASSQETWPTTNAILVKMGNGKGRD